MTARMRNLMSKYISEQQRAFVAGRVIQDNVIIAHEVFQYLKRRKEGVRCDMALKIDLSKAYDRVDWVFLMEVMLKMGFCVKWVGWVMECVTSVEFELLVFGRKVARISLDKECGKLNPSIPDVKFPISKEEL
ncbi:uncharacterized protein LOC114736195 [Neltuma alba]|uniref:uncharacterized protein LOC114736195 n=1 Tax=Neltuma alba TaxID=207710 RepID=UPI0010A30BE4|nr:uncharacterized protein LOC114736195 [Prosopis alba]